MSCKPSPAVLTHPGHAPQVNALLGGGWHRAPRPWLLTGSGDGVVRAPPGRFSPSRPSVSDGCWPFQIRLWEMGQWQVALWWELPVLEEGGQPAAVHCGLRPGGTLDHASPLGRLPDFSNCERPPTERRPQVTALDAEGDCYTAVAGFADGRVRWTRGGCFCWPSLRGAARAHRWRCGRRGNGWPTRR
jgi:hypothetical protein